MIMADEKYTNALYKLIDAKDEITRLRADIDEARSILGEFLALPVTDSGHGDLRARARAFIDR